MQVKASAATRMDRRAPRPISSPLASRDRVWAGRPVRDRLTPNTCRSASVISSEEKPARARTSNCGSARSSAGPPSTSPTKPAPTTWAAKALRRSVALNRPTWTAPISWSVNPRSCRDLLLIAGAEATSRAPIRASLAGSTSRPSRASPWLAAVERTRTISPSPSSIWLTGPAQGLGGQARAAEPQGQFFVGEGAETSALRRPVRRAALRGLGHQVGRGGADRAMAIAQAKAAGQGGQAGIAVLVEGGIAAQGEGGLSRGGQGGGGGEGEQVGGQGPRGRGL